MVKESLIFYIRQFDEALTRGTYFLLFEQDDYAYLLVTVLFVYFVVSFSIMLVD